MNYNPLNSFYKSIRGAVAAGDTLRLRVMLPRSFGVRACFLVLHEDNKADRYINMSWEFTDNVNEWWTAEITFDSPALYFYHFEYRTDWGQSFIKRVSDSFDGLISGEHLWQLTVYEKSFETPSWISGGIIYQIFPDRFYFSGKEKTGVPSDRVLRHDTENYPVWEPDETGEVLNNDYFCGDFKGIEEKIPYIASLGVNCIYLNPINEAHSNHRYDTADYMKPDPLLGTEEDFSSLCTAAGKYGVNIILDGVYSHTGADSVYFNKNGRYESVGAYQGENSPYYKWYSFNNFPEKYNCWWGFKTLPEVNENEKSFTEFITGENGVMEKWLSLGAKGFRLDVADELPDEFIDNIRICLKRKSKENYLLGEVWEDASNKISGGGRRRFLLGKQLDSVMNYPFRNAVIDFLLTGGAEKFMYRINCIAENYPPAALNVLMNHLGTHDTERILTVLSGINCSGMTRREQAHINISAENLSHAIKLYKMALVMIYTLPGVPAVYYGDEAGLTGGKDPFNRSFYPWGRENGELLSFVRSLGKFRRNMPVLSDGGFYPISALLGCAAFLRYKAGEKRIFVICNKNTDSIDYYLNNDMLGMTPLFDGELISGGVRVPAESCVILTD